MHELSVATELYRLCRSEMEARGGGRLEAARIAVGELAGIEPELLQFAWDAVIADGPDAGARLDLDWRPAKQRCSVCGPVVEKPVASWLPICSTCGQPLSVDGGRELDLLGIGFSQVPDLPSEY